MAKASIKKQEPKRDEVEFGPKAEKNIEINSINNIENNETNLEDLKNILQDLKNVLTNLGVNISELEVSLASDKNEEKNSNDEEKVDEQPKDSDVLLISETQGKVVLPYKIEDVEKILDKNKSYSNIQDVIDGEYTFPIDKYKNSSKSRFKEAYNLMRKNVCNMNFDLIKDKQVQAYCNV